MSDTLVPLAWLVYFVYIRCGKSRSLQLKQGLSRNRRHFQFRFGNRFGVWAETWALRVLECGYPSLLACNVVIAGADPVKGLEGITVSESRFVPRKCDVSIDTAHYHDAMLAHVLNT
jgi:hypothetical protein